MLEGTLLPWILSVIGGCGIGAAVTYFATFRSNRRKAAAEATVQEESAEQAHIETENKIGVMEFGVIDSTHAFVYFMTVIMKNINQGTLVIIEG